MISTFAFRDGGLQRQAQPDGDAVWIDLLNPAPEEEKLAEQLTRVDVPTRGEMAAIEESARLYQDGDALYMTTVVVAGASGHRPPVAADVTFVLAEHALVTVRYADPLPFRSFEARCARQPDLCGSAELVFLALVEAIVGRVADLLEAGDTALDAISVEVFRGGDEAIEGGLVHRLRAVPRPRTDLQLVLRQIGRVGALAAKLRQSLLGVGRMLAFFRQSAAGKRLQDEGQTRLAALERDVRSLAEHDAQQAANVAFLLDATLGMIDIEQNRIIKVFSIAAVLFLPPTLVGTVYGMNFEQMPELHWTYGYPLALLLMVLSAVVPYYWFKRRGWF